MTTENRITEMAAHIRHLVKREGIKARVRVTPGYSSIQVFPPKYEIEFSNEEQRKIRFIADCNKLTLVQGMKIDINRMTDPHGMQFYLP
jgi:hypothetical protein